MEDERGQILPHQWIPGSTVAGNRQRLVLRTAVPAFGYRQVRLRRETRSAPSTATVHAETDTLENDHLRVRFAAGGTIGIFDKDAGRHLFRDGETGGRAIVIDDPSDTWSHDVRAYTQELGTFGDATIQVLERGPLRARMRVRSTYEASYAHHRLAALRRQPLPRSTGYPGLARASENTQVVFSGRGGVAPSNL